MDILILFFLIAITVSLFVRFMPYLQLPLWCYQKLIHLNVIDLSFLIIGIAIVFRDFEATHHFHKEEETYYFLYGQGRLLLGADTKVIQAPAVVAIPSNRIHAMTPVSRFVILVYTFQKGPFCNIKYTYLNKKMVCS